MEATGHVRTWFGLRGRLAVAGGGERCGVNHSGVTDGTGLVEQPRCGLAALPHPGPGWLCCG